MKRIGITAGLAALFSGFVWYAVSDLAGVAVEATAVADSGSYYVYHYDVSNPVESTWGLLHVKIDLSTAAGTPGSLPATGEFLDLSGSTTHAEVGPISPSGWSATLTHEAALSWYPPSTFLSSADSVGPGGTKSGFGIRSSYLPGLSAVTGFPTPESCCATPVVDEGTEYRHVSREYPVSGITIAPRYRPSEVDLDLLDDQIEAVCSGPLRIHEGDLCGAFADVLDAARAREAVDDVDGVVALLDSVTSMVLQDEGVIDPNARWLIYLNANQIIENIVTP